MRFPALAMRGIWGYEFNISAGNILAKIAEIRSAVGSFAGWDGLDWEQCSWTTYISDAGDPPGTKHKLSGGALVYDSSVSNAPDPYKLGMIYSGYSVSAPTLPAPEVGAFHWKAIQVTCKNQFSIRVIQGGLTYAYTTPWDNVQIDSTTTEVPFATYAADEVVTIPFPDADIAEPDVELEAFPIGFQFGYWNWVTS